MRNAAVRQQDLARARDPGKGHWVITPLFAPLFFVVSAGQTALFGG